MEYCSCSCCCCCGDSKPAAAAVAAAAAAVAATAAVADTTPLPVPLAPDLGSVTALPQGSVGVGGGRWGGEGRPGGQCSIKKSDCFNIKDWVDNIDKLSASFF